MHYTISKENAQRLYDALENSVDCVTQEVTDHKVMWGDEPIPTRAAQRASLVNKEREHKDCMELLQGLLVQPEDDGSDWFYKLKFICRVLEGVSPDKTDMQTALGMARSLFKEKHAAGMAIIKSDGEIIKTESIVAEGGK